MKRSFVAIRCTRSGIILVEHAVSPVCVSENMLERLAV